MNYILFGGSGFIGTHLIHLLLKECVRPGDVIYDLDLVMPGEEGVVPGVVEKNDGVQYIRLDVRKPIDFEFVPTPEDVIFDLAAVHRTPGHPDEAYFETNIRGAENVTAFAEKYGIRKIQFTLRKRSSLLDDQTIGRNMFRFQLRDLTKVSTPCLSCLSGDCKHQIYINILKPCFSCPLITLKKFFICMNSSKHPQLFRIRGLQSQTQTVDSCFSVSSKLRKINCAGI